MREPQLKREYVPPQVQRVKLLPNEVVLAGCKDTWLTGPGGADCTIAGARPPCSSPDPS